ncbi:MAG: hypothetical protein U1E45_08650 [Geminicoccaceae bacterium]
MNLVSSVRARCAFVLPTEEMEALYGQFSNKALQKILEQYRFMLHPGPTEVVANQGLTFKRGVFANEKSEFTIGEFTIYNDGFVAEATITEIAESFLFNFVKWSTQELNFSPVSVPRRIYTSNIIVEFETGAIDRITKLDEIASLISKTVSSTYKLELEYVPTRIGFSQDVVNLPSKSAYSEFVLERRAGLPFENNRFFSSAPFPTTIHLEVLQAIEKSLL